MSTDADSLRSIQKAHVIDALCEGPIEGLVAGLKSIYLDGTPLVNRDGSQNFTDVTPPEIRLGTRTQALIPWQKGVESGASVGVEVTQASPIERTIVDPAVDAVRVTMLFPQLMKQESDGDLKGTKVQYRISVKGASMPAFVGQNSDFSWRAIPGGNVLSDSLVTVITTTTGASKITGTVSASVTLQSAGETEGGANVAFLPATIAAYVKFRRVGTTVWTKIDNFELQLLGRGNSPNDAAFLQSGQWSGDLGGFSVDVTPGFAYEVRLDVGPGSVAGISSGFSGAREWAPTPLATVSGKSTSAYQRSHLIRLPAGDAPWIVRVTRVTDDSTSTTLQNKSIWDSLVSIYEEKLNFPHTALVGFAFDSKQFSGIPQRSYHVRLLQVQVPSNYNPKARTYSGDWNGTFKTAWTNNPVWCWYDLATNTRYGVGDYITPDMLDKWSLYEMARYCDELVPDGYGSKEPRFTCNLYLQTREDAYKVLSNMAAIFRAMAFWGAGQVNLSQDRPKDPVYLFTNANVVDGNFQYVSSNIKTRHNVALVAWNDPRELYRQRVEYVDDPDLIVRWGFVAQTDVVALGCTSRAQAYRVGRWLLYTERYEAESISFETGLEGNIPRPGDVIDVADQHRAGARIGGRLVAVPAADTVQLDQAITLDAGVAYTLQVINSLGAVEERPITTAAGTTDTITVASAWDSQPAAGSIWMMASPVLVPEQYRVVSVAERDGGSRFAITAVLYNGSKFGFVDEGQKLEIRDTSILGDPFAVPPAPSGLAATDSIYVDAAKVVRSRITLSWQPVPGQKFVRGYLVSYRLTDGTWQELPETSRSSVDVNEVQDGALYELRVASISQAGKKSDPPASITYTPLGKARPPADVATLTATVNTSTGGVDLAWPPVADIDVTLYEVRQGASWDSGAVVFSGLGYSATVPAAGTSMTFLVKAKDAERYSTNATGVTVTIQTPLQPGVLAEVIDNNVLLRWTDAKQTLPVDYYEIRRGPVFASATVIGTKAGLFTTVFETQAGAYIYWVVGIDRAGNYGVPGSVPATVSAPPDYALQLNQAVTAWDTLSNAAMDTAGALLPVNATETWTAHFTGNSWTTPQDQVTAGFPVYAQPGLASGFVEKVVDAGATLPSSRITANFIADTVSGSPVATCTISVSNTSATGPWTDFVGVTSVYATAFRWAKVRVAVTGGLALVRNASIRMEVKEKSDSGEATVNAADAGGTTVSFTQAFASVKSITLTPKGTAARQAIYDFAGGVNPTSFKILLFDNTGTRQSGTVSWKATGV